MSDGGGSTTLIVAGAAGVALSMSVGLGAYAYSNGWLTQAPQPPTTPLAPTGDTNTSVATTPSDTSSGSGSGKSKSKCKKANQVYDSKKKKCVTSKKKSTKAASSALKTNASVLIYAAGACSKQMNLLSVPGNTPSGSNAGVGTYCSDGSLAVWKIIPVSGSAGWYYIRSALSNTLLRGSGGVGNAVQVQNAQTGNVLTDQQWRFVKAPGGGFTVQNRLALTSRNPKYYLSASGCTSSNFNPTSITLSATPQTWGVKSYKSGMSLTSICTATPSGGAGASQGGASGVGCSAITVYADANYSGPSSTMACGETADLANWASKIGSIKIPAGVRVDGYRSTNFGSWMGTLRGDQPDLGKVTDSQNPGTKTNYAGRIPNTWNDAIQSMKIAADS